MQIILRAKIERYEPNSGDVHDTMANEKLAKSDNLADKKKAKNRIKTKAAPEMERCPASEALLNIER